MKEALRLLTLWALLAASGAGLFAWTRWKPALIPAVLGLALFAFTLYFFRDPERPVPADPGAVVSPADGVVVEVAPIGPVDGFDGPVRRVAIFLSVWDVHVNRMPVDGTVVSVEHRPGAFLKAFLAEASGKNEQTVLRLRNPRGLFEVRQIAGILARRIVCRAEPGKTFRRGERFGMIKFGSRTEILCPASVRIRVAVGDRVRGGETCIGEFTNETP